MTSTQPSTLRQDVVQPVNVGAGAWPASRVFFLCVLILFALPNDLFAQAPAGGSIYGRVKSGNMPLPGVTVTATNTLTGQKTTTWTDVDGNYSLQVPGNGRYVVRTQMAAFAPVTQEVLINTPDNQVTKSDLELILLSRVPPENPGDQQQQAVASAMGGRGFQSLQVTQGADFTANTNGEQSANSTVSLPGSEISTATESVAVSSNNNSNMNGAAMNPEEWRQRVEEMRQQGGLAGGSGFGGPGGFGGGGFGGPGGFGGGPVAFGGRGGGRGRFNINRPHGTVYYNVGDDALNAAPYSLSGAPSDKPSYIQHRFGAAIGGPLNIPKVFNGGSKTFFFLNYNGSRGENPFDQFSTVPTLEERAGNFTGLPAIYDPVTHTPFPNNTIPNIDPIAAGLLAFIPTPNVPGAVTQNFHFVTSTDNRSDDFNFRLNRSFGAAQSRAGTGRGGFGGRGNSLSIGIHYHGSHSNLTNSFPSVGGNTDVRSIDVPISYTRTFGKITNVARFDFNRNRIQTQNLYAFSQDITGNLGITGVSQNPFDWGLPNLSFSHFAGLNDFNPRLSRNQTFTLSDSMIWNHAKHTVRWGGDFRRIQINTETDNNARGSFTFTGINTSQTGTGGDTGYDFADFLLGLPQLTTVQFGENNYHFRGNSWDLFVQDEWRVRGNLTFNLGLRYEYVSPFTEISDHLANLNIDPQFLTNQNFNSPDAVTRVLPGQAGVPASLVKRDRNNLAPRLGVAWKATGKTVVRAGYGINYNTGAYQSIVQQLAFQPPFSTTTTNRQVAGGDLTLADGFPAVAPNIITNNFGVNPDYTLGYVQIWNVNVQREIRPTLILNLDYTGTKGTALDIVEAPNRAEDGTRIATVQPFNWETSGAASHANAGSIRVRKRLQNGFSIGGTYTYSKSIDDASSIGGGSTVVAQDPFNLAAERGLSSFDQRHRFTGDYLIELPFGHDKRWLRNGGFLRTTFGDWQWSGSWTIASGLPFTPRILGDPTDVNRGTNGTLRPDFVPGQSINVSNPSIREWFNTAAFTQPEGLFGDARRNSIEGPGSVVFNMGLTKTFQIKEGTVLEFRAQASNLFNTPQYASIDTVLNSPTFGQVVSVGSMRTIQLSGRFRF